MTDRLRKSGMRDGTLKKYAAAVYSIIMNDPVTQRTIDRTRIELGMPALDYENPQAARAMIFATMKELIQNDR